MLAPEVYTALFSLPTDRRVGAFRRLMNGKGDVETALDNALGWAALNAPDAYLETLTALAGADETFRTLALAKVEAKHGHHVATKVARGWKLAA